MNFKSMLSSLGIFWSLQSHVRVRLRGRQHRRASHCLGQVHQRGANLRGARLHSVSRKSEGKRPTPLCPLKVIRSLQICNKYPKGYDRHCLEKGSGLYCSWWISKVQLESSRLGAIAVWREVCWRRRGMECLSVEVCF